MYQRLFMPDPISVLGAATSVANLVQLALQAINSLYRYYEDAKKGPARSAELREELGSLVGLLQTLEETLRSEPGNPRPATSALRHTLKPLEVIIRELEKRTHPDKTEGLLQKLKWPFTKEENGRLLSQINRYSGMLTLALNIEQRFRCFARLLTIGMLLEKRASRSLIYSTIPWVVPFSGLTG